MTDFIIPADVLTAHLEEEAVLLHMRTKNYYRLNGTAAALWKGLEAGLSHDDLLARVGERYGVDRETVDRAFQTLSEDLLARKLIVRAGGGD